MRELVRIVPLALVHNCDRISEKLVHAVMAWTCAYFGQAGLLFDYSLA
jgi:hypothetical protein